MVQNNADNIAQPTELKSVAGVILEEFFDSLEKEDGYGDVAKRLRALILKNNTFAEPLVRSAMFLDES